MSALPFDQRACFIAGQAKSGTTLLAALLDGHPELLVLPQETAYFPTVLRKYQDRGRRAQFDYLTKQSFSRVLFGGEQKWREHEYKNFPQQKFLEMFEQLVSDPATVMKNVCDYLEINFDPDVVLTPTKIGQPWGGNSAARIAFSQVSAEPASRWKNELSEDEIGWVEWHCRDLMPEFGYEPWLSSRALRYFTKPRSEEHTSELQSP